ncbi:TetR/AcrR family transcriptional regulator [Haloimpatiens massiliensis]|uniref:TetR/AcrR family transcriptional regulator n=1 Tax=Haloimpatiens massiliensis TaxID=1658110 RepID=UPI0015E12ACB|nr:TetR/AcrR family transcriptional regulator [Haloimpatiens massiliensis]
MKRAEKNIQSKNKIFQAALNEFGSKNYSNASVNNICSDNNLSKGLIYHYFQSKDELFLLCVKECLNEFSGYLKKNVIFYMDNVEKSIENYFMTRDKFFTENKEFRQIFYDAVLQPPNHLKKQIGNLKEDFDLVNRNFLEKLLKQLDLRENVSADEALDYFIEFQEFFNSYFQKNQLGNNHISDIIKTHEIQCHKIIDIILYGIAKQGDKK